MGGRWRYILPSVIMAPQSRWLPSTGFQSQQSGRGCILSPAQVQHGLHLQGLQTCLSHWTPLWAVRTPTGDQAMEATVTG